MIARSIVIFILLTLLPDMYLYLHYVRHRKNHKWWKTVLWWIPSAFLVVFAIYLSIGKGFLPHGLGAAETYLFLFGLIAVPKLAYSVCSFLGLMVCRLRNSRVNWGNLVGLFLAVYCVYVVFAGSLWGFSKLKIRQVELTFSDLPDAFDGYRIAVFSDAHIGTLQGSRKKMLERVVDSLNAQHADMIAFVGDLQNIEPQELYPHRELLCRLEAKDGVYSVLGNHDYSYYSRVSPAESVANEKELQGMQRQFGWNLLMNEHLAIHRGNDSIVVAGLENGGNNRFPKKDDIAKATEGVDEGAFMIMLEHDPTLWQQKILHDSHAQLTLSGHTHGGQVALFGFKPTSLIYSQNDGLHWQDNRAMYVTCGVGALVPFRYGVPGEIVVITLKSKKDGKK